MATDWVEANGIQLRYELCRGPGQPLVLIHEMGGALESWDAVMAPLAARRTVLRYDQRGVGLSEKPPGPVTVEQLADDLAALLDALGMIAPVAVVGTAVGAAVAAAFAARHPARTEALLLLAPAFDLKGDRRALALRRIEAIERDGMRAAFATIASDAPHRFAVLRLAADPEGLCAIWRMLVDLDMTPLLGRIACPTLVVSATRDTARPPAYVAEIAGRIPGARAAAIDSTHYMAIETPELVVETISRFLDAVGFA